MKKILLVAVAIYGAQLTYAGLTSTEAAVKTVKEASKPSNCEIRYRDLADLLCP